MVKIVDTAEAAEQEGLDQVTGVSTSIDTVNFAEFQANYLVHYTIKPVPTSIASELIPKLLLKDFESLPHHLAYLITP